MRHALALALALAFGAALAAAPAGAGEPPLAGVIVDTASGERLTPVALARRLGEADVAILGEVHDNPVHHRRQAWLIERLAPAGVAFEMVPEEAEPALRALSGEAAPLAERLARLPEVLEWESSGWPDWEIYRPVFAAAGEARLTGGGVARAALETAMREGAAAADPARADAAGLSEPLPPETQAALEAAMVAAHCDALPPEMAPGMVEAQRLRDARLAAAVLRARGAGERAVLVTGNGHARTDRGVPRYLERMAPELTSRSLGQIEVGPGPAAPEADRAGDMPYDFVWFSEPAAREDPCAAFADPAQD